MAESLKRVAKEIKQILCVERKLKICKRLKTGAAAIALYKDFDTRRSTIYDIKRNEENLASSNRDEK